MKMKISNLQRCVLKPADGKHNELCGRIVLLEEMNVLKGVSVLTPVCAREWQYKDILNDIDGLMWESLSEDWQTYLSEGGESLAL